jgi:N-acetylmuramoyl-L-alanine amidase
MRRIAPVLAVFFVWAAPAHAKPIVNLQASATVGAAPLTVTLTASGDAATYHWDLGDGSTADGPVVQHQYGPGRFTARVTATDAGGEIAQASVVVTSAQLSLYGPKVGTYGRGATFRGRMVPALKGAPITLYSGESPVRTTKLDKKGRFAVRVRQSTPASYSARFETVPSNTLAVAVRPGLDVAVPHSGMLGRPLVVRAVLRPRSAGTLHVRVWRSNRELAARDFGGRAVVHLSTKRRASYVIRITATPTGAFLGRQKTVRTSVFLPYLAEGARGQSVRTLERRLAELHYLLRGVDGFYSYDTADAVLAFQKVNGLARTGRVTPTLWRRLQSAHSPRPRYRYGHHIEVDKSKQVLFEVNHGHAVRVVHVSTGATGNTPVGLWHIYSKVPGTLPTGMFDSNFFLRGFAIHGYPDVPPWPASHGCVRVPMWVATRLFAMHPYGFTIRIYG